jgi:hypothetical protein
MAKMDPSAADVALVVWNGIVLHKMRCFTKKKYIVYGTKL